MALDLVFGKTKSRHDRGNDSSVGLDIWPTTYFKKHPSHRMKTGLLLAAGAAVFWFSRKPSDR